MKIKSKIIIFTLVIVALITIFNVVIYKKSNSLQDSSVINQTQKISNVKEDELELAKEYMSSFDDIVIVKAITKSILHPDGTDEFIYDENVVSFVNIKDKTDKTITKDDYLKGEALPNPKQLDFVKVFNFDYKKYDNLYDMMIALTEAQGINTDLKNATHDDTLFTTSTQNVYTLNGDSPILKNIISELDYDEIQESYCRYRLTGDGVKTMYIGYVNAFVKYTKGDDVIFYNLICEVSIPESELGCGCGCGNASSADCEEGIECPIYQSQGACELNYE